MREEKGQDLVEFALIAPLLFLLLFGIMEFGVVIWRYNTMSVAAREGTRAAVVCGMSQTAGEAAAKNAAEDYAKRMGVVSDADIPSVFNVATDVYSVTLGGGVYEPEVWTVHVTATYIHDWIVGLFPFGPLTLRSQSRMIMECPPS